MPELHATPAMHHSTAKYREGDKPAQYAHSDFPKLVYKGAKHKQVADAEAEAAALADGFTLDAPKTEAE